MSENNEYRRGLQALYGKSLMLHDTALFHPVLKFFFIDACAHLDYTLGLMSYNYASPKNIMSMEYLRWRVDEEKKGDRPLFRGFVNWLKANHPDRFERLPAVWRAVYDDEDPAGYRSFRLVLDPDSTTALPLGFFTLAINELFDNEFLKSLYEETGSLARFFEEYRAGHTA
ncbi:MAG: hypothetical protein GXY82_02825 [Methanospirillum sp.]|nr:hypothetical protein [Methanospirillum sp.]